MPVVSLAQFVEAVKRSKLLDADQLTELARLARANPSDARAVAKELLQRGWLTAFQANLLLQGGSRDLVIGSYVLLERLGGGGMGHVYKARHLKMERLVALKVIRKERLANPDAVRRFQREAKAAARLSHPNIVTVYDLDQTDATHYLAMEYVEGTDLARLVEQRGPLPVGEACEYVRQAALGLQHACQRGLVHRDIKPSNLMVAAEGGYIKVLDLGLARMEATAEGGASSTLTHEGSVMGTPDYVAPEQAVSPHHVDIRADIYSLGCTLYHLLTGHPPFPGGSLAQKLVWHIHAEPPPVEGLRSDLPGEVVALLRRMLAKKPEDRPQKPAEVAAALAPWCGTPVPVAEPAAAPVPQPPSWTALFTGGDAPAGGPTPRPDRRRARRKLAAGVALAVGGCLLGGLLVVAAVWLGPGTKRGGQAGAAGGEAEEPVAELPLDPDPLVLMRFDSEMRFGLSLPRNADTWGSPKKLTYSDIGGTNNTCVRIDGDGRTYGFTPGQWREKEAPLGRDRSGRQRVGARSSWLYPNESVVVTQTVELVSSPQTAAGSQRRSLDTCVVRYLIENRDQRSHRVGLRFLLDTLVGGRDAVPFALPGEPALCGTARDYTLAADVPDFLQALERSDLRNPGTVAHVTLRLGGVEPPDRVSVTKWLNTTAWEVPMVSMQLDSGVVLYWNEKDLKPKESREVGFAYGLGFVSSGGGKLGLTLGGPFRPGEPFTLLAYVSEPGPNESLTLKLPVGLERLGGEVTQLVAPVPEGASYRLSPVTWRLQAARAGRYRLSVESSGGVSQSQDVLIRAAGGYELGN